MFPKRNPRIGLFPSWGRCATPGARGGVIPGRAGYRLGFRMGVRYDFYLEGNVGGRWVCLDGFVVGPDGRSRLRPTLSGGSPLRKLLDEVSCWEVDPGELSPEVRGVLSSPDAPAPASRCRCFDPAEARVPEGRHQYERYVPREAMNDFENGEADSIDRWLTEAEFAALGEEERRGYTFYRWDDPWGAFAVKRRLQERIAHAVGFYEGLPGCDGVAGVRVVVGAS